MSVAERRIVCLWQPRSSSADTTLEISFSKPISNNLHFTITTIHCQSYVNYKYHNISTAVMHKETGTNLALVNKIVNDPQKNESINSEANFSSKSTALVLTAKLTVTKILKNQEYKHSFKTNNKINKLTIVKENVKKTPI